MSAHRCDICVDPACDGKKNCDCTACSRRESCHRQLRPTIRITTRCTQSCRHCCFECSPSRTSEMTPAMAGQIAAFMAANGIRQANIMGGEFFCHPQWEEIVGTLVADLATARVVTNGDWAGEPVAAERVVTFFKQRPHVKLSVSRDRWHTNAHVDAALALLAAAGISHNVATEEEGGEDTLVPVGRMSFDVSNYYGMFQCYCSHPHHKYASLIDELGNVFKCGFGHWCYADTADYLDGGFAARFKEFTLKFDSAGIMSCNQCNRACPPDRRVANRG